MKPKAALVKDGFLPPDAVGRGRMSRAMIERCQYLVDNENYNIEGFAKSSNAGKPALETAKPVINRVKTDPNRLVDVPDMRRDERMWTATVKVDGKDREIGFRTVCNGCGSSLGWCYEETSRVWVDSDREAVVNFKPKAQKGAG